MSRAGFAARILRYRARDSIRARASRFDQPDGDRMSFGVSRLGVRALRAGHTSHAIGVQIGTGQMCDTCQVGVRDNFGSV